MEDNFRKETKANEKYEAWRSGLNRNADRRDERLKRAEYRLSLGLPGAGCGQRRRAAIREKADKRQHIGAPSMNWQR